MLSSVLPIVLTCLGIADEPGAATIIIRADPNMFCYLKLQCPQDGRWVALNFERFCLIEKRIEGVCTTPEAKTRATQNTFGKPKNTPAHAYYTAIIYDNCSYFAIRVHPGTYKVLHSLNRNPTNRPAFLTSPVTVKANQTLEIQCNQTDIKAKFVSNDSEITNAIGANDVLPELGEQDMLPDVDNK